MRIVSWNVNGIRAVSGKGFSESLKKIDADIVGIQETKAQLEQLGEEITNNDGYGFHYFSSAEKKGYSGTALYSKTEPISIEFGLGTDEFDHEGRTIIADYEKFVLFNIYFPNGGRGEEYVNFKLRFYDAMLLRVKKLQEEGREVIVCGDVNTAHKEIDLSNPKANSKISGFLPEERVYIDKFLEFGLTDAFRMLYPDKKECYTWWSYKTYARERNVGWRIDYFFVTDGLKSKIKECSHLTDIFGSDHCPIMLELDL